MPSCSQRRAPRRPAATTAQAHRQMVPPEWLHCWPQLRGCQARSQRARGAVASCSQGSYRPLRPPSLLLLLLLPQPSLPAASAAAVMHPSTRCPQALLSRQLRPRPPLLRCPRQAWQVREPGRWHQTAREQQPAQAARRLALPAERPAAQSCGTGREAAGARWHEPRWRQPASLPKSWPPCEGR